MLLNFYGNLIQILWNWITFSLTVLSFDRHGTSLLILFIVEFDLVGLGIFILGHICKFNGMAATQRVRSNCVFIKCLKDQAFFKPNLLEEAEFKESFVLENISEPVLNGEEVVFESYDKDIAFDDHLGSSRPMMW